MSNQQIHLNRESLENSVSSLQFRREKFDEEKKEINKRMKCVEVCIIFLGGILDTHSRTDIPRHDSNQSLFFFKDKNGESVLIEELKPDPQFMPEMKRIPLESALTQKMKQGGLGYVIQRVLFSYPVGKHELVLICFEKNIFERI